jgi:hypothetical protein
MNGQPPEAVCVRRTRALRHACAPDLEALESGSSLAVADLKVSAPGRKNTHC